MTRSDLRQAFALVMALSLMAAPTRAMTAGMSADDAPAIVMRGDGPVVVLLSGLLGGVARLELTADALVARGFRVIVIDPYRLSAHAPDVSFHGMAREVARALARSGVQTAVVVAHGHAASIALRLAADSPRLVEQLVLLDGGLLPSTRSPGVARAMQLAAFVARLPGGQSFIRGRLTAGIRANSGDTRWLTEATAREYADGLLTELPAVARMADRLANAREPEAAGVTALRLRAPTLVLVGSVPHEFAPKPAELDALVSRPTVRVQFVEGVGHFVHEEALSLVVDAITSAQARRAAALTAARTSAHR